MFTTNSDAKKQVQEASIANQHLQKPSIAILGAGLSGSLLYSSLKRKFGDSVHLQVFEQNSELRTHHTWSFHGTDIPYNSEAWFADLPLKKWDLQQVFFPEFQREFKQSYFSLTGPAWLDWANQLLHENPNDFKFECRISDIKTNHQNKLQIQTDKEDLQFDFVFDCRGWSLDPKTKYGYQKFYGKLLKLSEPHSLNGPVIMDATVEQMDGYRFVYLLPFSENILLVEDTYYSNSPVLNLEMMAKNIQEYVGEKKWKLEQVLNSESGCLPLGLFPSESADKMSLKNYFCVGARSELFQPVTGYTMPMNLKMVNQFFHSEMKDWNQTYAELAKAQQSRLKFLRFLNRMLFLVAKPEQRYLVLQRFYRMNEKLIARFYSGDLKYVDMFRLLIGKPPVSVLGALRVLFQRRG